MAFQFGQGSVTLSSAESALSSNQLIFGNGVWEAAACRGKLGLVTKHRNFDLDFTWNSSDNATFSIVRVSEKLENNNCKMDDDLSC